MFEPGDIRPWKFVKHDIPPLEKLSEIPVYKLLVKANRGVLTKEEKDRIAEMLHSSAEKTSIKQIGWCFPFRSFLRHFYVKTHYYGVQEIWAFNKMQVRNILARGMGKIYDICETNK
jgi:hypothetical protein